MLNLYTENLFFLNRVKYSLKSFFGRQNRGPKAVELSLLSGLDELGAEVVLNKTPLGTEKAACVLSGAKTLQWAIRQKQLGKIKRIIAGPNIVINPNDENGLLKNNLIDVIIVPSLWVKDIYVAAAPVLAPKIRVWPAGVTLPPQSLKQKTIDFLVYNKLGEGELFKVILNYLDHTGYSYKILEYGKFRQEDYFNLLDQAKYEIYLSASESQGLAMFEAWARGVPTLVWESGRSKSNMFNMAGKVSAPYLSPECGMVFAGREDFSLAAEDFLKAEFSPRGYVDRQFTNKICAQKYLNIINDN